MTKDNKSNTIKPSQDKMVEKKCIKCRDKGQAWFHSPKDFHCPTCGMRGFISIYSNNCTACANAEGIANGRIKL